MGYILALGVQMIFESMPKEFNGSRIERSARILGIAIIIIPIASFVYFFSPLREEGAQWATAINLNAYCLVSTLTALACYNLMDIGQNKPFIRTHLAVGILFPIPMWISLYWGSAAIVRHILVASYTLFCVLLIIHFASFLYFYLQRTKNRPTDESPLEGIELAFMSRILHTFCALATISLISPAFFSYPLWVGGLFIMTFLVCALYIYINYHRAIMKSSTSHLFTSPITHEPVADEPVEIFDENTMGLSDEIKAHIEKHIVVWIKKKEFRKGDISISYVAKEIYTNRTYLSRYINATYGCSFKNWVTALRIEDAKAVMLNSPDMSISNIATLTGFTSVESFSHIFSRLERSSPSKWREENS
ncbi:MAG: helix-turn-helix domain-containing protein [Rikenellaceae bacterium]